MSKEQDAAPGSQITWGSLYQPVDPDGRHFRILTLHRGSSSDAISCGMRIVSLEEARGRYHALSYRWGDDKNKKQIIVNGTPLSVTANLHSAFQHLRFAGADRDLWIDQICINQGDKNEKLHQIGLMKPIYAESIHVIVWLGEADRHMKKLADILSAGNLSSSLTKASKQDAEEALGLILHMCRREWWTRVWVVQECVTSVNPSVFQCGDYSFDFNQLDEAFDALWNGRQNLAHSDGNYAELPKALEVSDIQAPDLLQRLQNMLELREMITSGSEKTISLIDCLQLPVSRSASDPPDYVRGFLGLMPPGESQELLDIPDEKLFHKFVTIALRSGVQDTRGFYQSLRIISFEKEEPAGPSWVPDLSAQSFSNRNNSVYLIPFEPAKTQFHPEIWFENNDTLMNMAGFYLDTVTDTLPLPGEHSLRGVIASLQDRIAQSYKPPATSESGTQSRLRFRRLFTCNPTLDRLPYQPEMLDQLWDLWIQEERGHTEWSQKELGRKQRSLGTVAVQNVFDEFYECSNNACEGRAWFRTNDNYVGIAIPGICVDDVVMLPRGFVMPLILRPSAGSSKLIGGAYVDGLIEDGAIDKLVSERCIAEKIWNLV